MGQLRQGHGAVLMLASSASHLLGEPVAVDKPSTKTQSQGREG